MNSPGNEHHPTADQPKPSLGWRDDPITTADQDTLQRAQVAQRIARLIDENHSPESSVVYGLEGPWGCGKSSVIALITTFLTKFDENRWHVVSFTPWATSGTEGLLSEFFSALATVAPKSSNSKDLRGLISTYADIARPFAALIPVAGSAVAEATRSLETRLSKPWNVAFEEIATELRTLGTPVLVVVDDIDRLQPGELFDLLKVVRLLGRFPGVDFLLAYDEQTLIETLQNPDQSNASKARARAFMEKIVQYPLSIPPLLTSQIVKILDAGLTEILTPERVETSFDRNRFGDIILSTMPSQLTTPRAIERFLAQVREQFRSHDLSEMNDVDLILTVFLKVQFPDVFARLQSWKSELTRSSPSIASFGRREVEQPDWDQLFEVLDRNEDRRDARAVLAVLFPATRAPSPSRAAPRRFAHPDYFDRYLAQAIPEHDVPDAIVSRAIEKAAVGNGADLHSLLSADDESRVTLTLSKIRSLYPDIRELPHHEGPSGPVTLELLTVGMTLVNDAEDRLSSLTSNLVHLTHWAATLLRRLVDANPKSEIDCALMACSDIHRRTHVITTANRDVDALNDETAQTLREALHREADRLSSILLNDLRQGDESKAQAGNSFLYDVIAESPTLESFRADIANGLESDDFSLEDIAARLVSFSYIIGGSGRPSYASFSGALFTKITGIEARSVESKDVSDCPDTGWLYRRQFTKPLISPRGADAKEASGSDS
ncbi:KAP family NTPase [Brachybacterium sp. J144]|uniref:KAP family NTPase n=1 Tax=Brachybacterium sp. J144 TaxID=3116487 RepID=UPI002E7941FD|nr:KAP family NTPase [Brachybacterium sp. J144]MEE1652006.1 KAP family NTPase [Brachybacterium sp. J144]